LRKEHLFSHSPFLSTIEKFWAKAKGGIKHYALRVDNVLTERMIFLVKEVKRSGCHG
jgi:hypothetical protein